MDRLTFPEEAKVMGWGLADEDLVAHALNHLDQATEPFFWIIQSQTNHHPYEVPDEFRRHTAYSEVMNGYFNGILYTDHCLGLFLDRLLQTPQGRNSLIIVTADHGLGVSLYDPERNLEKREMIAYNVPLLVLYPADQPIAPRVVETLGGQPDIMPTILDLLRLDFDFPVFGRSLARGYQHRFAKALISGSWLIADHRIYFQDPPGLVKTWSGTPLSPSPEDWIWLNLIREIDDVQDWMIHQKDPLQTAEILRQNGWKR